MKRQAYRFARSMSVLLLFSPVLAAASTERVYVKKVMEDRAIIERRNGDVYLIEKGTGCLSLWRFEGKDVIIHSPGLFLGVGSRLLIPDLDQECRIWDSELLETNVPSGVPPFRSRSENIRNQQRGQEETKDYVLALQQGLKMVGLDPGPLNGIVTEKTASAFAAYLKQKGLESSDEGVRRGITRLAIEVLIARPKDSEALSVAAKLSRRQTPVAHTVPRLDCEDGHWVQSVTSEGSLVVLEDGSIWEIDSIDAIDTSLWLPTEDVMVCGGRLINTDTGDVVNATRVK